MAFILTVLIIGILSSVLSFSGVQDAFFVQDMPGYQSKLSVKEIACPENMPLISVGKMVFSSICHMDAVTSGASSNLNVEFSSRSKGGKSNYNQGHCWWYRIKNSVHLQGRSLVCKIFNISSLGFFRCSDRYVYAIGRLII